MNKLVRQLPVQALSPVHHARNIIPRTSITTPQHLNQSKRYRSTNRPWDDQAIPLTGYYADILNTSITKPSLSSTEKEKEKDILDAPLSTLQAVTRTSPTPPSATSLPKTEKEERLEKARVVFGSRLAGPVERRAGIDAASRDVAGVMVPPKPEEPDNCCMSGCVNCVWDVYRDDMEEWASKSAEARVRLRAQRMGGQATRTGTGTGTMKKGDDGTPTHVAVSMDDDGGGSETNWVKGPDVGGENGDLFEGIPVGIRAFMRTEKMLKEKHSKEKSLHV